MFFFFFFFFLRDQHKGDDECVKDLWSGCVVLMFDDLGDFELNVQFVSS
jgi:hypothetical protein